MMLCDRGYRFRSLGRLLCLVSSLALAANANAPATDVPAVFESLKSLLEEAKWGNLLESAHAALKDQSSLQPSDTAMLLHYLVLALKEYPERSAEALNAAQKARAMLLKAHKKNKWGRHSVAAGEQALHNLLVAAAWVHFSASRNIAKSLELLEQDISLFPDSDKAVEALLLMSEVYHATLNAVEVQHCAIRVLRIQPENKPALLSLGDSYAHTSMNRWAAFTYSNAIQLSPETCYLYVVRSNVLKGLMRFEQSERDMATVRKLLKKNKCQCPEGFPRSETSTCILPGHIQFSPEVFGPKMILRIANEECHNAETMARKHLNGLPAPVIHEAMLNPNSRLHLGLYSGACFGKGGGVVNKLLVEFLKFQNAVVATVSCFCQSQCHSRGDEIAKTLQAYAGEIYCQSGGNQGHLLVQEMNSRGVHIMMDVSGHAAMRSLGPLVWRPAPVQMHLMEYPSTIGGSFIDYRHTSPIVTPPEFSRHLSEHVLQLGSSWLSNGLKNHAVNKQFMEKNTLGRAVEHSSYLRDKPYRNIPTMCSYQRPVKLNKDTVEAWFKILQLAPGSRLIMQYGKASDKEEDRPPNEVDGGRSDVDKLKAQYGISDNRVVLTPALPFEDYLESLGKCDVFLDSPSCNAGATTLDASWIGTPVLTMPGGPMFAQRAASAMNAHLSSVMTVHNWKEYVDLGASLMKSSKKKAKLWFYLQHRKVQAPLFDTALIAADMQRSFEAVHDCRTVDTTQNYHWSSPQP